MMDIDEGSFETIKDKRRLEKAKIKKSKFLGDD